MCAWLVELGSSCDGRYKSAGGSGGKLSGKTPSTTTRSPLSVIALPIIARSPFSRFFHRLNVSTVNLPALGRSSSAVNVRPRIGETPKTLKNSELTCKPVTGLGRSPVPRFMLTPKSYAAMESKDALFFHASNLGTETDEPCPFGYLRCRRMILSDS